MVTKGITLVKMAQNVKKGGVLVKMAQNGKKGGALENFFSKKNSVHGAQSHLKFSKI